MKRHISYRNFTLCKAVLLACLIGLATWMGDLPKHAETAQIHVPNQATGNSPEQGALLPAAAVMPEKEVPCDKTWLGISL